MLQQYSTASVPRAERLTFWNDLAVEHLGPMAIDADDRDTFRANMGCYSLGSCDIICPGSSGATIQSASWPEVRNTQDNSLLLEFQHAGRSASVIDGRVSLLNPGDFVLFDKTRPFSVNFNRFATMVVIRLPHQELARRALDLDRVVGVHRSGDAGPGAMLSSFVRTTWDQLQRGGGEEWADSLGEVMWRLIDLSMRSEDAFEARSSRQTQSRHRARAFIERHLCDPALDIGAVADHMKVTPRYVQMLFAEVATTPSGYIMERRLNLVAEQLRRGPGQSVSEIAYAAGFNDLSYFSRAFRKRFGVSARDYRAGRRGPDGDGVTLQV